MRYRQMTITNQLGLHARAAAKLVETAKNFNTISLIRPIPKDPDHEPAWHDAKSIMSLLTMAAGKGTQIELQLQGDDEEQAEAAISKLIEAKFGED